EGGRRRGGAGPGLGEHGTELPAPAGLRRPRRQGRNGARPGGGGARRPGPAPGRDGGHPGGGPGAAAPPAPGPPRPHPPRSPGAGVALVGKGITFDTGGVSIKPAHGMWEMTSDMAGAAAVAATMLAVAARKPDVAVTGWLPMAENMPSGTAYRPGDVITM